MENDAVFRLPLNHVILAEGSGGCSHRCRVGHFVVVSTHVRDDVSLRGGSSFFSLGGRKLFRNATH